MGSLYAQGMSEPVFCPASTADDRTTSDRKEGVQFRLQLVVVNASGHEHVQEVSRIERDEVAMETLGLTLAEGKLILKETTKIRGLGRCRQHDRFLAAKLGIPPAKCLFQFPVQHPGSHLQ